jgi:catechol 2,3-dioxygenase-like lactoylglutathione lyase family enzyme
MSNSSPCMRRGVVNLESRAQRGTCFFLVLFLTAASFLAAQTQPARSKILGIASVRIYSTNVAGARDFYSKTLSPGGQCLWCEEAPRPPLRVLLNEDQMISIDASPQPTPSNFVAEVSFAVDDLEELTKYLKAQKIKVTVTKTPTLHIDAVVKVYSSLSVTDPEGHLITFVRRPSQALLAPTPVVTPSNSLHIIHAGFIVHDRAATEHFYKDILGFRPYWHGGMKDDETDWVSMQVPDGTDWLEFMVNVSPDADQRLRGIMNHIAIGVTDIHATEQRLEDSGVDITEQPKIGRDGKWQLNLYDPDDTRVEFMEFKPVEKPCCSEFTATHPGPKQ